MAITPLSGGSEVDTVWGDFSGGSILFTFTAPTYMSKHQLRVIPFDTVGTGLFVAPPGGTTTGLQQEADNISALVAACYGADTSIAAVFAQQTLADHSGQAPYAFTFTAVSTVVGTDGATSLSPVEWTVLNSRGSDGSRWRLALPGVATALGPITPGKVPFPVGSGPIRNLINYLTGQTNGGVHPVKTNVVTHNGVPIQFSAGTATAIFSKRLRRRFGLI